MNMQTKLRLGRTALLYIFMMWGFSLCFYLLHPVNPLWVNISIVVLPLLVLLSNWLINQYYHGSGVFLGVLTMMITAFVARLLPAFFPYSTASFVDIVSAAGVVSSFFAVCFLGYDPLV